MDVPEKGSTITVTVEEAFDNCVLISYSSATKLFRGVLLDESQNKPAIRSNNDINLCASKLSNLYTGNLGVTAARACPSFSDTGGTTSVRMSTRSSTMTQATGVNATRSADGHTANKTKDQSQSTGNAQKSGSSVSTKKVASPVTLRKGQKQVLSTSGTSSQAQDAKNKKAVKSVAVKRKAGTDSAESGKSPKMRCSPAKADQANLTKNMPSEEKMGVSASAEKGNGSKKKLHSPVSPHVKGSRLDSKQKPSSQIKRQLSFHQRLDGTILIKKKSFIEKMSNLEKCINKMRSVSGEKTQALSETGKESVSTTDQSSATDLACSGSSLSLNGKSTDSVNSLEGKRDEQVTDCSSVQTCTIQTRSRSPRLASVEIKSGEYLQSSKKPDSKGPELSENEAKTSDQTVSEGAAKTDHSGSPSHDYGTRNNYANTVGNIVKNARSNDYAKLSQTKGHLNQLVKYIPLSGDSLENIKAENVLSSKHVRKPARMKTTPIKGVKPKTNPTSEKKTSRVNIGDIIWGKVHGHPWWPGRILAISGNILEGGAVTRIAHVAWLGSNTSSFMPCQDLLPFTEFYSKRYKKGKRGAYRVAVREAQAAVQSAEASANVCVLQVVS